MGKNSPIFHAQRHLRISKNAISMIWVVTHLDESSGLSQKSYEVIYTSKGNNNSCYLIQLYYDLLRCDLEIKNSGKKMYREAN